jgi:hypothetical protein
MLNTNEICTNQTNKINRACVCVYTRPKRQNGVVDVVYSSEWAAEAAIRYRSTTRRASHHSRRAPAAMLRIAYVLAIVLETV